MRSGIPLLLTALALAGLLLVGLMGPRGGDLSSSPTADAKPDAAAVEVALPGGERARDESGGEQPGSSDAAMGRRAAVERVAAPGQATPQVDAEAIRTALGGGPMSQIEGRVKDAGTGRGAADVLVSLEVEGVRSAARTDERGEFTVPWPEGVIGRLTLRGPNYVDLIREEQTAPAEIEVELVPAAQLTVRLSPVPSSATAGEVLAWLRRSDRGRDWERHRAEVLFDDRGGLALFGDLAPGEYALAGRVGEAFVPFQAGLELAAGEHRTESLALELGQSVRGVVRTGDGQPVEAASIELRLRGSGMPTYAEREFGTAAISDANGEFELPRAAPGEYRLTAVAPWGARDSQTLDLATSASSADVELELSAPSVLEGSVVDARGRAIAGVAVRAVARRERAAIESLLGELPSDSPALEATSDSAGRFRLEGLPGDVGLLVVALPPAGLTELVPAQERVADLDSGVGDVVLVLEPGRTVYGTVSDADTGDPVAGAEVELAYPSGRAEVPWRQSATDPMGRFAIPGAIEGTPLVYVRAEAYREGRARVTVGAEGPDPEVDFELEPTAALTVRVVDEGGFAVPGVRVRGGPELGEDASKAERSAAKARSATGTSDSFGLLQLGGLPHGEIEVRPIHGRHEVVEQRPRRVVAPRDAEVTLVVRELPRELTAMVFGTVIAAESGAPVEGLMVDGLEGGVLRRERDRFEVSGVVPGSATVTLEGPGRVPLRLEDVELLPGAEVDLGAHALPPAVEVDVRVTDEDGEPVDGARVRLRALSVTQGGIGDEQPRVNLKRDGPGRYTTAIAQEGRWILRVTHPDFRSWRAQVEIPGQPSFETEASLVRP